MPLISPEPRFRPRVVAILAGGGSLPREIAESLAIRAVPVHILALKGEADDAFAGLPVTPVGWGEVGLMLDAMKKAGARDLILVGRVRRPDLKKLRPDFGFLTALPELLPLITRGGGDDHVLRGVIAFFEKRGLRISGPREVTPELVVGVGPLGRERPNPEAETDIALGLEIVQRLGPRDVGQGVVVADGKIVAIEASENTDAMLERVASTRRVAGIAPATRRGVVVKCPKPGQDMRIDLPAIGPDTVTRAADACLAGIAVAAGGAIAAHRAELIVRADTVAVFVVGVPDAAASASVAPAGPPRGLVAGPWHPLTRRKARADGIAEAEIGAAVARDLASYDAGRTVVVARRHVLAVDAADGPLATIARAAGQRQWGEARSRKRRGVGVLHGLALTPDIVAAAAQARLKGLAVFAGTATPEAVAAAEAARLFVIARTWQRKDAVEGAAP